MMKRACAGALAGGCLLMPLPALASAPDGIVLMVSPGPADGEVTLVWTGGVGLYTIVRSSDPSAVARPANVVGQTNSTAWMDLPPVGDVYYYEITGIGCADGTAEQSFTPFMHGCGGVAPFVNRGAVCTVGWNVCDAPAWMASRGTVIPTHDYWTADRLGYAGNALACSVAPEGTPGYANCPFPISMLVCNLSGADPNGNTCSWHNCSYSSLPVNQYFGGCSNTAGALCCYP